MEQYLIHIFISLLFLILGYVLYPKKRKTKSDPKMLKAKKEVRQSQKNKCFISGKELKVGQGDVHHLNDVSHHPWIKYAINNMVFITKYYHVLFHTVFKNSFKERCTKKEFILFVSMLKDDKFMKQVHSIKHKDKATQKELQERALHKSKYLDYLNNKDTVFVGVVQFVLFCAIVWFLYLKFLK